MRTSSGRAALVLEDGTVFQGKPFGAVGESIGEAVFYTGVVGYQEIITDPSYRGTLAVLTYPIVGSYGVNPDDNESPCAQARGVVIRESSPCFSNFRATGSLEEFLAERGVVGIRDVDTRAVTVHLRGHGEMKGAVVSGDFDVESVVAELKQKLGGSPSSFEADLVKEVSREEHLEPVGAERHRIALLDLGVKNSLLGQLAELGSRVDLLRCDASAEDVLAKGAGGVIIVGGPGDPRVASYVVDTVKGLLGKVPLFGIGLGHQVLALALGCEVKRMKVGHRGVNQSVKAQATGKCEITVQNHGFVVEKDVVPDSVEVTHVNVNDGTVEGVRSREFDARSVQFHPGRDEMEKPNAMLGEFCEGAQG